MYARISNIALRLIHLSYDPPELWPFQNKWGINKITSVAVAVVGRGVLERAGEYQEGGGGILWGRRRWTDGRAVDRTPPPPPKKKVCAPPPPQYMWVNICNRRSYRELPIGHIEHIEHIVNAGLISGAGVQGPAGEWPGGGQSILARGLENKSDGHSAKVFFFNASGAPMGQKPRDATRLKSNFIQQEVHPTSSWRIYASFLSVQYFLFRNCWRYFLVMCVW